MRIRVTIQESRFITKQYCPEGEGGRREVGRIVIIDLSIINRAAVGVRGSSSARGLLFLTAQP